MAFFAKVKQLFFPEYEHAAPSERELEADRVRQEQVLALRSTLRQKREDLISKRAQIHEKVDDIEEAIKNTLEPPGMSDD